MFPGELSKELYSHPSPSMKQRRETVCVYRANVRSITLISGKTSLSPLLGARVHSHSAGEECGAALEKVGGFHEMRRGSVENLSRAVGCMCNPKGEKRHEKRNWEVFSSGGDLLDHDCY